MAPSATNPARLGFAHETVDWDKYITYRPAYPQSFFDRIYKHHEQFSDSWDEANDCGSGAGQCAEQLAKRFKKVHVSEPNELYLNFAQKRLSALGHPKDKFAFYAEGGEKSSVKSNSLDLLTICEALHWCDIELAMKEFTRQLKSGGTFVIAHYTKPYCATDGKLSQLWDELWALGLGKPADDMRKRGFRNAGSAYDQVGFPEDIWQPGTQRILTNCKGNEKFMYRQGVDPPAESKVGENDKRIFVDDDEEWIVDADIAWLKEVYLAMLPWKTLEQGADHWKEIEKLMGDKKEKFVYPSVQIIASKK